MLITLKRNGRIFFNKQSLKDEEILDLYIGGKKQMYGVCFKFFTKSTGINFKNGETRTFKLIEEITIKYKY